MNVVLFNEGSKYRHDGVCGRICGRFAIVKLSFDIPPAVTRRQICLHEIAVCVCVDMRLYVCSCDGLEVWILFLCS